MDKYRLALDDFRDDTTFDYVGKDFMFATSAKAVPAKMLQNALDFETVVCCHKGHISAQMEGCTPLSIECGQILICPDDKVISDFRPSEDAEITIFCYTWEILEETISNDKLLWPLVDFIKNNPVITIKKIFFDWLKVRLPYLHYISKSPDPMLKDELLLTFAKLHIYELIRMIGDSLRDSTPQNMSRSNEITRKFYDVLVAKHGSARSVAEIATEINISPKYLSRIVKGNTGNHAMDIIRLYTTRAIDHELKYKNKSMKETEFYLGFPSPTSFSKYVRMQTGLSATDYRKKLREEKK